MERAQGTGRRRRGAAGLNDILGGQPANASLLAEIYDLEHDAIVEDLAFYRQMARRHPGPVIDLGCGSGRLFAPLLAGGATRLVGIDGSPSLLERAEGRIGADTYLAAARADDRIELVEGDVRRVRRDDRFALAVMAGVVAHLDGPEDALRALACARRLLARDGVLVVDTLGPGGLPVHDLPLSLDWERSDGGRRMVRRSRLERRETPEGLRVAYSTLTDIVRPDGTIARLPASWRLWYPSPVALVALAAEAELAVESVFGSHDLDPLNEESERCIVVARPTTADPGKG
ncbi:MAG TPA: class I SAM-dependent methyltransferase [Candidatus Limnocylindrales bacterium]|nr:class I SAM-dependent methyltransferase [Candidatus Limnocylindrales bacterium]